MDGISMIVLAVSALVGFLVAGLLGKTIIPLLHKLHYGQTIREEGPSWHQAKQGTPTMGGLLFIIGTVAALIVGLVVGQLVSPHPPLDSTPLAKTKLFAGLIMALCCAAIGWADDYIKVVKKRNLGLTAGQKLFAQLLVATGYAVSVYMAGGSTFYLPFFGRVDWGIWFIPFCIFVIVAMTNATNLTDGLDGLCGSVSFLVTLLFLILAGDSGGRIRRGAGRLLDLEFSSRAGVYGGHGIPVHRRAAVRARVRHWPALPADPGGDHLYRGEPVGDPAGDLFQADSRKAAVQDEPAAPSFRDVRMERNQNRDGVLAGDAGGLSGGAAAGLRVG